MEAVDGVEEVEDLELVLVVEVDLVLVVVEAEITTMVLGLSRVGTAETTEEAGMIRNVGMVMLPAMVRIRQVRLAGEIGEILEIGEVEPHRSLRVERIHVDETGPCMAVEENRADQVLLVDVLVRHYLDETIEAVLDLDPRCRHDDLGAGASTVIVLDLAEATALTLDHRAGVGVQSEAEVGA